MLVTLGWDTKSSTSTVMMNRPHVMHLLQETATATPTEPDQALGLIADLYQAWKHLVCRHSFFPFPFSVWTWFRHAPPGYPSLRVASGWWYEIVPEQGLQVPFVSKDDHRGAPFCSSAMLCPCTTDLAPRLLCGVSLPCTCLSECTCTPSWVILNVGSPVFLTQAGGGGNQI